MNIIIDELPDHLKIGEYEIPIRTDFRIGMLFEMMIESRELSENEMTRRAFDLWFEKDTLEAIASLGIAKEALSGVLWFYSCGNMDERKNNQKPKQDSFRKRIYDFESDAKLIYSAFMGQYGIDLQDAQMHWWKFVALFAGLHEEEEIMKIIGYRSVNLASIKNKEERRRLAKLQTQYALPDHRSNEEKAKMAGAIFGGMR